MDWTLEASTSDKGNWLSVSAPSGTAPSLVTVGISVANLPNAGLIAGSFTGELVFRSANSTITIPVTVVVGGDTFTQVNSLSFTKVFGGADPLQQTLTISSIGADFLFSAYANNATGGSWLSVSKGCGYCNTPNAVTVTVTATPTLAVGTYTGQVVVFPYSSGVSMTIPVTLTIVPSNIPFLDNLPGQMSFSMKTAGTTITSQTIQVRNGGAGNVDWTLEASTSDKGNWLSVSAPSGTAPSLVTVGISVANLPNAGLIAGSFTGELVFRSANSTITIPVTVVVGGDTFTQVNSLSFTKVFGGADPLQQTLTISSIGADFLFSAYANNATGGSWLSVSKGCGYCNTPNAVTVTVTATPTLAVGTYTGQVVVFPYSSGVSMTIPVTLTIVPSNIPFLDNLPGQMSFSMKTAGTTITSQTIQVRNGGAGNVDWTLEASTSDKGNWLSVSAPSGTAPSLVTVGISVANLPNAGLIAGSFTGELVFRSANSTITIPVTVVVGGDTFTQVNSLSFTKVFGGADPLQQTLTISSIGADFLFSAYAATSTGGSWLSISKPCGYCNTPNTITAKVSASSILAAGTYTGQVVVYPYSSGVSMTVPVTLTITGTPLPPPVILGPGNGSTSVSLIPALTWTASSGAISYDVYFGTSSTPPFYVTTTSTSYTLPILTSNTLYYWQVVAKNGGGSASSGIVSFRTGSIPTLLWQNDSNRQVTVWYMGGAQGSTYLSQNYIGAAPGWTLRGAADMNRDGVPDLFWQNDTTRDVALWYMGGAQGSTFLGQVYIGSTPGWSLRGVADFNRDGVPDLLWQNDTTRQVTVWFMGGVQGNTYLSQNYIGATPGWTLRGTGDFNRDGVPDLLWQNDTTRDVTMWFMGGAQGSTYLTQTYIGATPGWTLRGAGDFNRDGVPDLLWQNDTTRDVTMWFMGGAQGSTYLTQTYLGATPGWMLDASQQ